MQIQLETIQLHDSYTFINWTVNDFQPILTDAPQIILPNVTY